MRQCEFFHNPTPWRTSITPKIGCMAHKSLISRGGGASRVRLDILKFTEVRDIVEPVGTARVHFRDVATMRNTVLP